MRPLTLVAMLIVAVSAAAPAAAKGPKDFVGIVAEDVFAGDANYRERVLKEQRRLGVQVIRQTFDWSQIERTRGSYDFSVYDAYVTQAARQRIRIMPVLFRAPAFHSRGVNTDQVTHPPRKLKTMARFAREVARRYGRRGTLWRQNKGVRKRPITAYQVWNEPNLPIYWGGKVKAKQYAKMLKVVRRGLRKGDRRAEAVTAGMPQSKYPGAVPLFRYIKQLYKAGAKKGFDTLAINTYAKNHKQLVKLLRKVRKLMNKRRDRKAKIWVSEFGWATQGPKSRFTVGHKKQARNIGKSIRQMGKQRRKLRLRGFVYWNWKDAPPYREGFDFWGLHAGLLGIDGSPKPALDAFKNAVKKL